MSCQDPWDERGWVSIYTGIVYASDRAGLIEMLNLLDERQARQKMQQGEDRAADQSISSLVMTSTCVLFMCERDWRRQGEGRSLGCPVRRPVRQANNGQSFSDLLSVVSVSGFRWSRVWAWVSLGVWVWVAGGGVRVKCQ